MPTIQTLNGGGSSNIAGEVQTSLGSGCPPGKVKLMGKCVSVAPAIGGTVGTVSTANIGHPLNPTPPASGSGNNATQTQTTQTMPTINMGNATIQPATGGGVVGTATTVSTVGVGDNTNSAATPVAEPWYKKYLWLEVAAAVIILAVALWLIFRKKK